MKIAKHRRQYESNISGEKKTMGFAADAASHLAELMSNSVYSDKYGSIIREVTSNAIDATQEAGSDKLVEIKIESAAQMSDQVSTLKIRDYGVGITPDRMDNIFTQYFASTKRDTNEQIGGFGIGAKSPFAYTPLFFVETHTDGVTRKYILEKTESDRTCTLMDEYEEDAESGTCITIPIHSKKAEKLFIDAIQKQLVFLSDKVTIYVPHKYNFKMPKVVDYGPILCIENLSEYGDDTYRSFEGIMICLGNIYYEIPHVDDRAGGRNFAIKFPIGSLSPTLSRESIEVNDSARKVIIEKLNEIDLLFDKWRQDQSKPVSRMEDILDRNNRYVKYPQTDATVYTGKSMGYNSNKIAVRTVYEGWPPQISYYNSIINKAITCKAYKRNGKWTTSRQWDFTTSIVKDRDWKLKRDEFSIMIKPADTPLGNIAKEYLEDRFPGENLMILNVERDLKKVIVDCIGKHDNLTEDELSDAVKVLTRTINEYFKRTTIKFKDYQPDAEWLERRKERNKSMRTTSNVWTKEALQVECPVKQVWEEGRLTRGVIKYADVQKYKDRYIFVPYQMAKEFHLEFAPLKPVTVFSASVPNLKKLASLGANVWDEERLKKNNRKELAKMENASLNAAMRQEIAKKVGNETMDFVEFLSRAVPGILPIDTWQQGKIGYTPGRQYFYESDRKAREAGVFKIENKEYKLNKLVPQIENYKRQLLRSVEGKVLYNYIVSYPDRDHVKIEKSELYNLFHTLIK